MNNRVFVFVFFLSTLVAFQVNAAPTLLQPVNNQTGCIVPVTLQWSNSAVIYNLQISKFSTFTPLLEDRPGIRQTSYTPTGLIGNTMFYWRVKGVNIFGIESQDWASGNFTTAETNYSRDSRGQGNIMRYNSIRMAHNLCGECIGDGLLDDFLQKAKDNKYNYILAEFGMDRGRNSSLNTKKDDFKFAYQRANQFGLRLIPLIQLGSCSAYHWNHAKNWNANIKMTRITVNRKAQKGTVITDEVVHFGSPGYSYDSTGFDQTFVELLQFIKKAHTEANVGYPLEFIHLGHDEPGYANKLALGNCKIGICTPDFPNDTVTSVDETCFTDTNFIQNYPGGDKSAAVQTLLVQEIYRRTEQVKTNLGSNVRVMIYGDMWDPQMNGQRNNMHIWDGTIVQTTPGIATMPGLSMSQKEQMRDKLIILPWSYDKTTDYDGDGDYKTDATFNYLSTNGFKFVYVHEITNGNDYPYASTRVAQAINFYNTAKNYKQSCLGYTAAAFTFWETYWGITTPKCFDSMGYLYSLNAGDLPTKDYKPDLSAVYNLLLND